MSDRFKGLPFPVHELKSQTPGEMFDLLPGLKRYFNMVPVNGDMAKIPAHKTHVPLDLVHIIKYIMFLYDPNTDLTYEYPDDVRLRKDAAAKEAGFKRRPNGEWPDFVLSIMNLEDMFVMDMVLEYLKVRNHGPWREMKFVEEEIDTLYRARANAIQAGTIKGDLMKLTKEREDELQTLKKRFFGGFKDLQDKGEERLLPITPENVFIQLKTPKENYELRQAKDVSQTA